MSGLNPDVKLFKGMSFNEGAVTLSGSFQGNGSSAISSTQVRGSGFTVARSSTGLYVVTLAASLPYQINSAQGWPDGLLLEPRAWIVSETAATEPVKNWLVNTSKYSGGTFSIWARDTGNAYALTDVTTADRVLFHLTFKAVGAAP